MLYMNQAAINKVTSVAAATILLCCRAELIDCEIAALLAVS
jgi:hypothetical protein